MYDDDGVRLSILIENDLMQGFRDLMFGRMNYDLRPTMDARLHDNREHFENRWIMCYFGPDLTAWLRPNEPRYSFYKVRITSYQPDGIIVRKGHQHIFRSYNRRNSNPCATIFSKGPSLRAIPAAARAWRRRQNERAHHRKLFRRVMQELEALPGLGSEYIEAKGRFEA